MGLIIRSSSIHAAGCYTTAFIAKGTRVVEYTGPLLDKETADRLYANRAITYLFGIGDGTRVIDGHGMAMFINHSCDANCETEEIDGHVWILAMRDIAAGEELCYDYLLYDSDEQDAPCNCGARTCRGSMYSPEELRRRRRRQRNVAEGSAPGTPRKKPATRKEKKSTDSRVGRAKKKAAPEKVRSGKRTRAAKKSSTDRRLRGSTTGGQRRTRRSA